MRMVTLKLVESCAGHRCEKKAPKFVYLVGVAWEGAVGCLYGRVSIGQYKTIGTIISLAYKRSKCLLCSP